MKNAAKIEKLLTIIAWEFGIILFLLITMMLVHA